VASAIGSGELLKDRYRLERTLGRGGMAAVWLGHDEVLDRPVAVKVLSDTIASDPGFVARFRREAQTAAGLSHPNLVGVYDFSEEGERPYLVMQFVPGESLAARLERGEGIDCEKLAEELLDAVAHIHEVGILHRDIKPANIIIEPDGTAKLIDFGIALPRDATALTSTGLVLGTERYAAPEVMQGEPATERSDLYSCGLVLQSCDSQCSRSLRFLVGEMTSKDPHDRPLSARHALDWLEQPAVEVDQPTEVLRTPPPPPAAPPVAEQSSSGGSGGGRKTAIAAVLGLLAALAVVAVVALGGGSEEPGDSGGKQTAKAQKSQDDRAEPEKAPVSAPADSEPEPEPEPEPEGADPATGAALNEEGFALMQAGEYEAAVPVLEQAVAAFPEGSEDLNYAYALFNLGSALRQSGRPDEAIPVLEQRLEIPNQEGEVRKELEAAYSETELGSSAEEDD
jgi:eukaryotic-like serine/threonine-protein kinase